MVAFQFLNIILFLLGGMQTGESPKLPQEFAEMRAAVCDKPSDFAETGCRVCPKFMGAEGPLNRNGLGIYNVLLGSFTSAGKTEAILTGYASCLSHAAGHTTAFLLRKEQGSWRRLSYFHNEGPVGLCQKIAGPSEERDLVLCSEEDYGAGSVSVIGFDGSGKVKTNSTLVQTWTYPFRSVEKQKHCSSFGADVKKVSFDAVEISIYLNSFDVDPPIDCDERESTTSKISNSKKFAEIAVFTRSGDTFAPDEKTKKLLSEAEKSR